MAEKRIEIVKFFHNNRTIVPFSASRGMFNSGLDLFDVKSENVQASGSVNRYHSDGQNDIRVRRILSIHTLKRIKNDWFQLVMVHSIIHLKGILAHMKNRLELI